MHVHTLSRHGAPQLIPDARQDAEEWPQGRWQAGKSCGKWWETDRLNGKIPGTNIMGHWFLITNMGT